jgi:hypothetical protein
VQQPTIDLVRALAEASGLAIPEERLELVLRQYESFRRSLDAIDSLPRPVEVEPAFTFSLAAPPLEKPDRRRED